MFGWKVFGTFAPVSRTRPAMSKPRTVGYVEMKSPLLRIITSAGLSAMDLMAIRSSFGPGLGVVRVWSSNGWP